MQRQSKIRSTQALSKGNRGRPRNFDRDAVLDKVMRIFWERGYESTSIGDLSAATALSASSIYAAFGDKERLFLDAVDRYLNGPGGFGKSILESASNSKLAVARLLKSTAQELSRNDQPTGCMIALALLYASDEAANVKAAIVERRRIARKAIEKVIQADIDSGRLPPTASAHNLTSYVVAVIQGMSAQARDGASASTLQEIGRLAMKAWPSK